MIESVGLHHGMTLADYLNDPCPSPSLNCTIAQTLLFQSPHHAWHAHPRLNRGEPRNVERGTDKGSAAHCILFGLAAQELYIVHDDSYRRADARDLRDWCRKRGKVPILVDDYNEALRMAEIAAQFLADTIGTEEAYHETVVTWQENGHWCRCRIDKLAPSLIGFLDYKTTGLSAEPESISTHLYRQRYHFQAAFYERALNMIDAENVGRRHALFLFQEQEPPYACSLIEPDHGGMTIGRKQVEAAIRKWTACVERNQWPSYPRTVHYALMPKFIESEWLARENSDPQLTGSIGPEPLPESRRLYGAS